MRRAICQNSQYKFYLLPIKCIKVHVDGIRLTLINFIPLTEGLDCAITDLILKFEDHVTVIGFIQAVDRCLKAIPGLDGNPRIFSGDESVIDDLRMSEQAFVLSVAIFHFRRIQDNDKAFFIAICSRAWQAL